jgi:hypothetical protein
MKFIPVIIFSFFVLQFPVLAQEELLKSKTTDTSVPKHVIQTIDGFLTWYKDNYFRLYQYSLTYTNDSGHYQVDTNHCKQFLEELKSTGFISDVYVRLWKKYFDDQAENFKINIQNEGPPEGFDMDLVLLTQEPEEVLNHITTLRYENFDMDDHSAVVIVHTRWEEWKYIIELSNIDSHWLIDYISLKEPD